jgi:hypothetical protein
MNLDNMSNIATFLSLWCLVSVLTALFVGRMMKVGGDDRP